MKSSVNFFGLCVVLSMLSISAFADAFTKKYVQSEDIIISESKIYLQVEENDIETLSSLYSDKEGLYILAHDSADQAMYTFREPAAGYECIKGHINPRYRKTCKECGQPVIH